MPSRKPNDNPFSRLQATLQLDDEMMSRYVGAPVHTWRRWVTGSRQPAAAVYRLVNLLEMVRLFAPEIHQRMMTELQEPVK